MELPCIEFTKMDPNKEGKENILVKTDASYKFSVAVIMPNQQAKTVNMALMDR